MRSPSGRASTVLFVCLHGSAKSLIAAEYFNRLARARGLAVRAESSGVDPDAGVPAPVVAGLARDGIDVRDYVPRLVSADHIENAACVVRFGCDLPAVVSRPVRDENWSDLPFVSDGFDRARDAIVARVTQLVDEIAGTATAE